MKRYFDEPVPVPDCGFLKQDFLTSERYLRPSSEKQVITGADAISGDSYHVHLVAPSGVYAVTLPNGQNEHEEQWIFWSGVTGSTSTFNVSGTFRGWTMLQFDHGATSALLKWVDGKWDFVMGTARPI